MNMEKKSKGKVGTLKLIETKKKWRGEGEDQGRKKE